MPGGVSAPQPSIVIANGESGASVWPLSPFRRQKASS
jgi:hypothetical protein